MNCHAIPISIKEKAKFRVLKSSIKTNQTKPSIVVISRLDSVINLIAIFFDYVLGLHAGAALGFISGACIGSVYTNYYQPANYDNWQTISSFTTAPYTFAYKGSVIGIIAGSIVITILVIRQSINKK